jgi:hypothetical protein
MPRVYDKMGVRFLYPDNWTLDEGDAVVGSAAVSVYSPEGSFWSIVLDKPTADPIDLAGAAAQAFKTEYDDCDVEPFRETVVSHDVNGFDVSFFCLDLTSTAIIRSFRIRRATCLVICQAEDRDYQKQLPVFLAITASLLMHDSDAL